METPPSEAVVETVANLEGREPLGLEPPLYRVIDPDALDALFDSSAGDPSQSKTRVAFDYLGYRVVVEDDATVRIE